MTTRIFGRQHQILGINAKNRKPRRWGWGLGQSPIRFTPFLPTQNHREPNIYRSHSVFISVTQDVRYL